VPAIVGETAEAPSRLQVARDACNARQALFAELYVRYRNKIRAYRESYRVEKSRSSAEYVTASTVSNIPAVRAYIRELESEAAAACVIDVQLILAHDLAIVRGAREIQDMQRREWRNCRHCHGVGHKWQWVDDDEYCNALSQAMDDNAIRAARKLDELKLPSDEGGYGFDTHAEPVATCTKCYGDGVQVSVFSDTTKLEGDAAIAFKGIKETKNGLEIVTHDIDKAKERLLRAAGVFGDDAASVAKGAAAGAAVGAAAAAALASRVSTMTPEEKRKAYLSLAN
jgi:phage terminase small subunit